MTSRDDLQNSLSEESFELLENFVKHCSKRNATLQGGDATRWNDFIIATYRNSEEIHRGKLETYLDEKGFESDVICRIDALALLEPELLKQYDNSKD